MDQIIKSVQEALSNDDVREAAQTLAKYDLGICIPHMHDAQTGELILLPPRVVSSEKDLIVSFVKVSEVRGPMVPVAWRWDGTDLEVCASCCAAGPE